MHSVRLVSWLGSFAVAALLASLAVGLSGCGTGAGGGDKGGSAGDLTVGFIYVGPKDDYGYNQAHAEGAAAVKKMHGRQGPGEGDGRRDRRTSRRP